MPHLHPQVDLAQPKAYLALQNVRVDMFRGSMRLGLDKWSKIEVAEGAKFKPKVRKMVQWLLQALSSLHNVQQQLCIVGFAIEKGQAIYASQGGMCSHFAFFEETTKK